MIARFATLEGMKIKSVTPVHHPMSMGSSANCRPPSEAPRLVAVVATLSKGYDLDYIWTQVDRGPAKDAASYYLQASGLAGSRQSAGGARAQRPSA